MTAGADSLSPLLTTDAAGLAAAGEEDLAASRAALQAFKDLPASASFAEVTEAFDAIARPLSRSSALANLFFQVHPDGGVREQAASLEQAISSFATELSLDRQAYDRLDALDLADAPDPVTARVIEHAVRDYRRAGVDRDEDTRQRVRALQEELVKVGQEFSRNIAEDVRDVPVPKGRAGLEGLPEDWIADHVDADGTVTLSTQPTDYLPVIKYAQDRDLRAAMHRTYISRAAPQNLPVLDRMLAIRHELATLLGYPHWAAFVTEDKMIGSADAAGKFIDRVADLARPRLEQEAAELLERLQRDVPDCDGLRDYDRAFYAEEIRRERWNFDAREVRPYLPYDAVRDGVLATAETVYGVTFARADVTPWHPDVEVWDVRNGDEVVGRFFLDMHSRKDKFKHAAMFHLIDGLGPAAGESRSGPLRQFAQASLVCNFPQPDAATGNPGLLEPDQLRTFFHEFGHLMHFIMAGRQPYLAVAGISTEWDFVEVPSQLFEEWGRDFGVLSKFARHHETGEVIPADLVARMNEAGDYGKGIQAAIQMYYAAVSLHFYDRDPADLDTTAAMQALRADKLPAFPHEEGTAFQASFGHLEGYTALYYTYMWSLVLAKDAYAAFGDDVMDAAVARRYSECVLQPGGSKDAADLMADFLGRPAAFDAFEAWLRR